MADAPKKITVEITNNDAGPRYVHAVTGMIVLPAGETWTGEMLEGEVANAKTNIIAGTEDAPVFTIGETDDDPENPSDKGEALKGLPIAKLRQIAEAEGVQLTGRKDPTTDQELPDLSKVADIIAAIETHRTAHPAGTRE